MMPKTTVISPHNEPQIIPLSVDQPKPQVKENYGWHICQTILNMIGRLCVGIVVGICIAFAFRNEVPYDSTNVHIVLCVIGYQLLMAEGFLALAPGSWAAKFTLVDRKRVHWILLLFGSILAIVGSITQSFINTIHFYTLHGKFALVAMVFTAMSLVNGFTSLYAFELRRFLPGKLSKLTHICFGVVAFFTSCVSLVYALKYTYFVNWMPNFNKALIGISWILPIVVSINPLLTFFQKSKSILKR